MGAWIWGCHNNGEYKRNRHFAKKEDTYVVIDVKGTISGPFLLQNRIKYDSNSFYVFVHWGNNFSDISRIPKCFIVPPSDIEKLKKDIEKWDKKSSDVKISKLTPYLDRWDLLNKNIWKENHEMVEVTINSFGFISNCDKMILNFDFGNE